MKNPRRRSDPDRLRELAEMDLRLAKASVADLLAAAEKTGAVHVRVHVEDLRLMQRGLGARNREPVRKMGAAPSQEKTERNAEIRRRVADGELMSDLAREMDLTPSRVRAIVHGREVVDGQKRVKKVRPGRFT